MVSTWKDYRGLPRCAQYHMGPYKRKAEGDSREEMNPRWQKQETGEMEPGGTAPGNQRRKNTCSPGASQRKRPC